MTPAIAACHLGQRFGRSWALAHLDLNLEPGARLLVAGANGSGKTTLLRLFAGLGKRTRGDLRIFGCDPERERGTVRSAVTLVSHRNFLYEALTALETVRLWDRIRGGSRTRNQLIELLALVDLHSRAHEPVRNYSAGMRKRLSLLRTRIEQPRLLLVDEPFAALDLPGQELVSKWLDECISEGATLVVASHALERAARLCEQGILLRRGQIAWRGPAAGIPDAFRADESSR